MNIPTTKIVIGCVVALIVYTAIVGPLRNAFDDRTPYINVFLVSPGLAGSIVAISTGLFFALKNNTNSLPHRRAAIGFSLLLLSGLINSAYVAWAMANRTELQKIIHDVPWRLFVWEWYWFVDVPNVVAAIGFVFLALAFASNPPSHNSAEQVP